jgi:hypothetical protein
LTRIRSLSLLLLSLSCAQAREAGEGVAQGLNPFGSTDVSVLSVRRYGPYLAADIRGRGAQLSMLAPAADPSCQALLRPESSFTYRKYGVFGRFERDGTLCDPVGVASLAAWRDRQPRANTRGQPVPRATARFGELGRDGGVALVRGRFPLANYVGIPAGFDLVALIPDVDECREPLARGEASLEFVPAGREAFRLVGSKGPCSVLGFAMPLPGS